MIVMIVSIVFAVMFLVLAVIFLMGKGDMLIAGYNTASEEERKTIDIKRLRIVMAVLMPSFAPLRLSSAMIKIHYWRLLAFLSL